MAQHTKLSFNYPTLKSPTSTSSEGPELVFYLYGKTDPSYNWPHDLEHSDIECDDKTVIPRTCSFTIATNEFSSFTADIVANYDFYDDWTNQPDSEHWRDHIGKFGDDGQNYYPINVTTVNPCLTSVFSSAPVISNNVLDYFPFIDGPALIPLTWTMDTVGAERKPSGCGPYTLQVQ